MSKFKVGDSVTYSGGNYANTVEKLRIGDSYTVVETSVGGIRVQGVHWRTDPSELWWFTDSEMDFLGAAEEPISPYYEAVTSFS